MKKLKGYLEWGGMKKDIIFLSLSGVMLVLSFFHVSVFSIDLAWIAILLCGLPIILEACIGLITEFDIKADVLVSMAFIASILIGQIFAAGEVAFIMQLGALLEDLTVQRAQQGLKHLLSLSPQTARRIRRINGRESEEIIPASDIKKGDKIRVFAGETIAADGMILYGKTSINQSAMTGESLPVDKKEMDEVYSGTINQFGIFDMEVTKETKDSSLQRMIQLVESADAGKAKIVRFADKFATWIVIIAVTSAILTWLVTGEIIRAVTILVVFCPCALVLATPTAIMAAIGNLTKYGILVKEGDALERMAKVTDMTFDKTGTLTYGKLSVLRIKSITDKMSDEDLFALLAAVESKSEHPIGKAVCDSFRLQESLKTKDNCPNVSAWEVLDFTMEPGKGVKGNVCGTTVFAGNEKVMAERKSEFLEKAVDHAADYVKSGCSLIYIEMNHVIIGYAALSDTMRKETPEMIQQLKKMKIEPILLTGDQKHAAKSIAAMAGIEQIYACCLPEDKLNKIRQKEEKEQYCCMVGDGINDAPALKQAYVGIAMGGIGSDIAVEAADIALTNDDILALPHLVALSRKMMQVIKINLTFSMGLNFIAIILAMTGILNPIVGALVHNAGSVLVISHSAVLLKWKKK